MSDDLTSMSVDALAERLRGLSQEYDAALLPVQRGLLKIEHIRREMRPIMEELAKRGVPDDV